MRAAHNSPPIANKDILIVNAHLTLPEIEYGLIGLVVLGLAGIGLILALTFVRIALRVLHEHWRTRRNGARAQAAYSRGAAAPGRPRHADAKVATNGLAAAARVERR